VQSPKGRLIRKNFFKPSKTLRDLQKTVPNLTISEEICDILNGNRELKKSLEHVNPDEMHVSLLSVPTGLRPMVRFGKDASKEAMRFYLNPLSVVWCITVCKPLEPSLRIKKEVDNIMKLLNITTQFLEAKVKEKHNSVRGFGTESHRNPR